MSVRISFTSDNKQVLDTMENSIRSAGAPIMALKEKMKKMREEKEDFEEKFLNKSKEWENERARVGEVTLGCGLL